VIVGLAAEEMEWRDGKVDLTVGMKGHPRVTKKRFEPML
jgi:hypothetical protein